MSQPPNKSTTRMSGGGKMKPKRALTAYNIFFKEERQKILEHGKAGGFAALAQTIAKRWKSISKEDYAIYAQKAADDKERYQREMDAWQYNLSHKESAPKQEEQDQKRRIVEEIQKSMISLSQQSAISRRSLLQRDSQQQIGQGQSIGNQQRRQLTTAEMESTMPGHMNPDEDRLRYRAIPHSLPSTDPFQPGRLEDYRLLQGGRSEGHNQGSGRDSLHDALVHRLAQQQRSLSANLDYLSPGYNPPFQGESLEPLDTHNLYESTTNHPGGYQHSADRGREEGSQQPTFTPGSLSRVFELDSAEIESIPEPAVFDAPPSAHHDMDPATQELVNRMLKREKDRKRSSKDNSR